MKVELIDYTGIGYENKRFAADVLVFSKQTRLKMTPGLMNEIHNWSDEEIYKELEYMANTIPSSWEMCNYTFLISDCTRAFTHQLVRNRHGSYAQQTMRILDVAGFGYEIGPTIENNQELLEDYCDVMETLNAEYSSLIGKGAAVEDARGILPTNIHTNIIAKFNLRTLSEIVSKRSSSRTQGEYRQFLNLLYDAIIEVHPWAEIFLRNRKVLAAQKIESFINEVQSIGEINADSKNYLLKQLDILRG